LKRRSQTEVSVHHSSPESPIRPALDLNGVSLILVGMMGSGKSSIGQHLAQTLGYQFFDTDVVIEQLASKPISQIFAEDGEANFRALETQVLAELSSYRRLVIATGGGIVLNPMNWSYLRHGLVVWLDASADQLWARLQTDQTRPLLATENPRATLEKILEERRSHYAQADVQVAIPDAATLAEVVDLILVAIPTVLSKAQAE
jgi:shikimate kinase